MIEADAHASSLIYDEVHLDIAGEMRVGTGVGPAIATEAMPSGRRVSVVLVGSAQTALEIVDRSVELGWEAVSEGGEVLADQRHLGLPLSGVHLEQLIEVGVGDVEALEVERVLGGQVADGGLDSVTTTCDSLEDPLEHA